MSCNPTLIKYGLIQPIPLNFRCGDELILCLCGRESLNVSLWRQVMNTKFLFGLSGALLVTCALLAPAGYCQNQYGIYTPDQGGFRGSNINQPRGYSQFDSGHGKMPGVGQNTHVQNAQWQARNSLGNGHCVSGLCPPATLKAGTYNNFQQNVNNQQGYNQSNQPPVDTQWVAHPVEPDNSPPPLDRNGKPKDSGF